jgi:hypothetical protein
MTTLDPKKLAAEITEHHRRADTVVSELLHIIRCRDEEIRSLQIYKVTAADKIRQLQEELKARHDAHDLHDPKNLVHLVHPVSAPSASVASVSSVVKSS